MAATPVVGIDVPSFHPGDPAEWQFWGGNKSALLSPLLTVGGQPPTKRWQPHYNYNVAESAWTPTAPDSAIIQALIKQRFYGAGGQSPTKQWHYDYDEYALWTGHATSRNFEAEVPVTPFPKQWLHYECDEGSSWTWRPSESALLTPLLTNLGQVPHKQWHYDYNEASNWTWEPPPSAVMLPLLTGIKLFGAPGQAPTKQWRYDFDEQSYWMGVSIARDPDLLVTIRPFFKQWRYDYNTAESYWTPTAVDSAVIQQLTGFKMYGAPGQAPTKQQWRFDYNESSVWEAAPTPTNDTIATITAFPANTNMYRSIPPDEAVIWTDWVQTARGRNLNLLKTSFPFFSKAWHYDYDQAAFWSWSAPSSLYTLRFAGPPIIPRPRNVGWPDEGQPGRVRTPTVRRVPIEQWEKEQFEQRPFTRQKWNELLEAIEVAEKRAEQLARKNKKRAQHLEEAARLAAKALEEAELYKVAEGTELNALIRAMQGAAQANATTRSINEAEIRARALLAHVAQLEDDDEAITLLLT